MKKVSKFILVVGVLSCITASAMADMLMTYAAQAGVTTSSVANSTVETFDSLTTGQQNNNVIVNLSDGNTATIDQVYVMNANQYGGAVDSNFPNGSPFAVQSKGGTEGNTPVTTITMATPINYFGFWWSAGDPANYLYFYSGGTLLGYMNTADLVKEVAANPDAKAYDGNPAGKYKGDNSGQAYAFLNFFDIGSAGITSIVMSNSASSGFESDNWTFRTAAYGTDSSDGSVLPGIAVESVNGNTLTPYTNNLTAFTDSGTPTDLPASVPEPSVLPLLGIGGLVLGGYAWRRRAKPTTV